ncbi:hypothetical protein C0J08_11560 [Marinomonas sp. CT5]|nr:hypothetical protein C0J08_11560 [Marinomonas sp. CT5]
MNEYAYIDTNTSQINNGDESQQIFLKMKILKTANTSKYLPLRVFLPQSKVTFYSTDLPFIESLLIPHNEKTLP